MSSNVRTPKWWAALIPFFVLVGAMVFVIAWFGGDAITGPSQLALLISASVAVAMGMCIYKVSWKKLEAAISNNLREVGVALIILVLIGAISGTWMISGVVPTLIYYGLKVLSPKVFLLACCLICALVSLVTGSSWTTIATLGVALIGIGTAQGYSAGWTAGAIISGAYFGDKISPLSDTTVLASSCADTPLFTHIRYMLITTIPSLVIACIVFLVVSLTHQATDVSQAEEISQAVCSKFNISPWLLLVPVFTGFLIARKIPAQITLFLSALAAGIVAIFAQPEILSEIAGGSATSLSDLNFHDGFVGLVTTFCTSTAVSSGNEMLDALIQTRGMHGMLDTVFIVVCACTFSGSLMGSGMLGSLTAALSRGLKHRTGAVAATLATGAGSNLAIGDQYLSILLTSNIYKKLYKDCGYEGRLLSRAVEDSATVTSVLVPWNSCGVTQATVLRVPTLEYLPYCIFNLVSPLVDLFVAAIGYKIFNVPKETPPEGDVAAMEKTDR